MYVLLQNIRILEYIVYFGKTWPYIVLHDFNLTYYSSITLHSFSILLFPKLCWHIGLTPTIMGLRLPYIYVPWSYAIYNSYITVYATQCNIF